MSGLLRAVLDAHGGLDRWLQYTRVEATIVSGGQLWEIKGQPPDPTPRRVTVTLQQEWASMQPFGADDWKAEFTRDRVAIENLDGAVLLERQDPRGSFCGHELSTPWDPLQLAYFSGYALWTYLTSPFLLALPGFEVEEIDPVEENGQKWPGLRARFPAEIASHSSVQEFYFDDDHLLRRHDYRVNVAGAFPAIQYISDHLDADGIKLPTKRRAYRCDADGHLLPDELMVSIDLSDFHFT